MAAGEEGTRVEGALTEWNDDRGFGFVTTSLGDRRVFVHISAFPRTAGRPVLGESLNFVIETASDGRTVARRIGGARMEGASRGIGAAPPNAEKAWRPALKRMLASRRPASFDYLAVIGFVLIYVVISVLRTVPLWVLGVYLGTSLLSFVVYAADKKAATTGGWRISESSLLALGVIGGWPGAIVGQQVFRHKTRKIGFRSAFWGTVVLNVIAFTTFTIELAGRATGA